MQLRKVSKGTATCQNMFDGDGDGDGDGGW